MANHKAPLPQRAHSLPDDWQPDAPNQAPAPPDRYTYIIDGNKKRVLCVPCARLANSVCDTVEAGAASDAACSECGAGRATEQLVLL